ncbi:MAG: HPr(Ser) kinase/phosphatase [Kiritimatiellae bacterium]|nr:HPr(Ser) kinase/phosphatase [Kiritimatiellia bacterium]
MPGKFPETETTVRKFYEGGAKRLLLQLVAGQEGLDRPIREPAINRPGLGLAGFFKYFPVKRIQLIGYAEYSYLQTLGEGERVARMEGIFSRHVPCVVYARNRHPSEPVQALAEKYSIPLLRTQMITGLFTNAATIFMEDLCSPRMKVHGTMLEVAGMGVLIEGPPGIGKSETALGLIKHGHALVADDCTQLARDGNGNLIGSAVGVTQHYMEIRGLGIIYVPAIFGVSAVRGAKQVDLVVTLMPQNSETDGADLDRTGANELRRNFLGVDVPQVVLPVAPGRDLVNVVETVAQEYKLRLAGQVAYRDLDAQIKRINANAAI